MSKVLLALDMDDTLTDTQEEVVLRLRRKLYDRAGWDDLKWVYDSVHANRKNGKHSTMLYPEHLRKIINKEIIRVGDYVTTVKPSELITSGALRQLIYRLQDKLGKDNFTAVIATHRDNEIGVRENTEAWLKKHGHYDCLDAIHHIDGRKHGNKIDYLKNHYPEHEILLLDDNPFGDLRTVHDFNESVLVYEGLCNYEAYQHQNKFTSIESLELRLMELFHNDAEIPW